MSTANGKMFLDEKDKPMTVTCLACRCLAACICIDRCTALRSYQQFDAVNATQGMGY